MEEHSAASRAAQLRLAIHELSERGLTQSAKWAAEQLNGLGIDLEEDEEAPGTSGQHRPEVHPRYLLAKTYFDLKVRTHGGGAACARPHGGRSV